MDSSGPWYTSYNRLSTGSAAGTFQATSANSEFANQNLVNSQAAPPATTSQLILQAAHTTATLAGQPSPFNPGGFLSPPPASYDVFSPLFHHSNSKQAHYATQHRQVLAQNQTVIGIKQTSPESDISNLRENYSAAHQSNFFEHQTSSTSPTASTLAWTHQNNSQLPSPFGILPHESVSSSPGPPSTKSVSTYDNSFNTHFVSGQPINNLNSPIVSGTNYDKKGTRSPSPVSSIKSTVTSAQTFFHQLPTNYSSDTLSNNYSTNNNQPSAKVQTPLPHQSCIVSTSRTAPSTIFINSAARSANEKQRTNFSLQNKTTSQQANQTKGKIYSEVTNRNEQHENSQSSPISFSIMDSRNINYTNSGCNNGSNKIPQRTGNLHNQQFHVLNQQVHFESTTPYRHYSAGSTSDSEYHHPGRSKSTASTDSAYSSNTSTQNGPDCGVVVPRRPSPLQAHSQASPLGHVPSPAYPMYNSPMATISSPSPLQQHNDSNSGAPPYKTGLQQQITPPSPLDVTVPRPSPQSQVAYSSVITRALGANEIKTYNAEKTFERQTLERQDSVFQKQQICNWESENRAPRKYDSYETSSNQLPGLHETHRVTTLPERQQNYFDASQLPLQDLSSCRGDPMSIVKNLQTVCQQASPSVVTASSIDQVKQIDERRKTESPTKKKKEKNESPSGAVVTEYLNRIPPPAHLNTNNQQQNGYFEFERWNLPPPHSKMFPSSSFPTQAPLHSTNFVPNPPHQSLITHHTPPLTYFPTFHISPNHHPHEFVENLPPLALGEPQTTHYPELRDDKPKVIVPDIEEELGFLQQDEMMTNNQNVNDPKRGKEPNTGFMTSYLKFLQGDRDPSPENSLKSGRKASWNRSKPYIPPEPVIRTSEGGMNGDGYKSQSQKMKEIPQIDYANDPRYFPLPKERKNKNFDSSDGGFSSDDDFPFSMKKSEKKNNNIAATAAATNASAGGATATGGGSNVPKSEVKAKKGRPIKPGGPTDRKRKAAAAAAAAAAAGIPIVTKTKKTANSLALPPRRETTRRKAKEKSSVKKLLDQQQGIDYYDNDEELGDSDSDPAWTPAAKLAGDEEDKRKKRGRPVISKRSRKVMDEDGYSSGDLSVPKKSGRKKHDVHSRHSNSHKNSSRSDEKSLAAVSDEDIDISPFKRSMNDADDWSGEFVVMKADLDEEFPPLWRIDGKTLLQKYEPFKSNGKTFYRNISTYSGWSPQNRNTYQQVPVKFWQQDKLETVVEFLREEMIVEDSEFIDKCMKETEKYQDNFEVYIQTLISQALDSNFLTEIFQEQDDYFLSNVKTVDDVTEERKQRLLSTTKWRSNVITAVSTWPCLNILKDLPQSEYKGKLCAGCENDKVNTRVLLYGQPYNGTTLEGSPLDPKVIQEKDFLFCRTCQTKIALFNKVAHQKYIMFLECARRVGDKRVADPHKDTTIILNELLADESWLNQLFKEVRRIWAEIDGIHYHFMKIKNIVSGSNVNSSNSVFEAVEGLNATSNLQLPAQNVNCIPQSFTQILNETEMS